VYLILGLEAPRQLALLERSPSKRTFTVQKKDGPPFPICTGMRDVRRAASLCLIPLCLHLVSYLPMPDLSGEVDKPKWRDARSYDKQPNCMARRSYRYHSSIQAGVDYRWPLGCKIVRNPCFLIDFVVHWPVISTLSFHAEKPDSPCS
jgi:hypothetical protein